MNPDTGEITEWKHGHTPPPEDFPTIPVGEVALLVIAGKSYPVDVLSAAGRQVEVRPRCVCFPQVGEAFGLHVGTHVIIVDVWRLKPGRVIVLRTRKGRENVRRMA